MEKQIITLSNTKENWKGTVQTKFLSNLTGEYLDGLLQ